MVQLKEASSNSQQTTSPLLIVILTEIYCSKQYKHASNNEIGDAKDLLTNKICDVLKLERHTLSH